MICKNCGNEIDSYPCKYCYYDLDEEGKTAFAFAVMTDINMFFC